MNLVQLLAACGDSDLVTILSVVRAALSIICFVIPVILIVLGTVDIAKAVTANDEKATKESQKRLLSRAIYAVVIFLIPTIVSLLFNLLPSAVFGGGMNGYTWKDCWEAAK